ncbi:50S ribosomal protein L11, partial [Candidatus Bathyarchaeota archaeon]
VKRIAKIRMSKSYAKSLKAAVKEVAGTCVSMGVTVDGKNPKEFQKDVDKGIYDDVLKED